jgi:hypothetical protein
MLSLSKHESASCTKGTILVCREGHDGLSPFDKLRVTPRAVHRATLTPGAVRSA